MKQRKPLYISIGLGFLALLLMVSYLKKKEHQLVDWSHPVPVLIATRDILKNTPIEEDMVEAIEVPKRFLQPGALKHPAEAIGRLAASPLMKGEQVLGTKLITYGTETGLAVKVPPGQRAISISIDETTGVGGLIKPDNYVDVLATFNFGDNSKDSHYTYTVLENVRVLAVSQDLGVGFAQEASEKEKEKTRSSRRQTATLALDPKQAQDLIIAQLSGELYLTLRSLSETDHKFDLNPSTVQSLTGLKGMTTQKSPSYQQYRGR